MSKVSISDPRAGTDLPESPPPVSGWGRWRERNSRILDAIVVTLVFVYNLGFVVAITGPSGWQMFTALLVVSALVCGPFVFRRRYPRASTAVMIAAAFAQVLLGAGIMFVDVMLAFAVFSLATRLRWMWSAAATVLVLLWLPLAGAQTAAQGLAVFGIIVPFMLGMVSFWLGGMLVRARRAEIEALREQARVLERQRDAQARIVAAEERSRIAREIHDIVSHNLSVVALMADGAASKVRTDPDRAEQAIITARDTSRAAMAEMRRMVGVLRTSQSEIAAPQPGLGQIEKLLDAQRAVGLKVDYAIFGEPVPLSEGIDLCAYRVVQEALTNAREHGGPSLTTVTVRIEYGDDELTIDVADDGSTASGPAQQESGGGHGLVGMRERVSNYGGTLRTGPRPGGGFEVHATLPLNGGAR